MILERLTRLASRMGFDDPLVEPIRTHVAVHIDDDGKFIKLVELAERTWLPLPREILRTSQVRPQILWDKPSYLFGHPPKTGGNHVRAKHEASESMHRMLADKLPGDRRVQAAAKFLACKPNPALADLEDLNYALFYKDEVMPIGSRPEIRPALREIRLGDLNTVGYGVCPVTGEYDELVVDNHAKIKPVPGANSSGGSLISFLPNASWSWGLESSANMAMGMRAFFGYPSALRWLLSNQRLHLTEDIAIVWWTPDRPHPFESIMGGMLDAGTAEASAQAFQELQELDDLDVHVCFAAIQGAQGRAHAPWFTELSGHALASAMMTHANNFAYGKDKDKIPSLRRILQTVSRPDRKNPLRNIRNPTALSLVKAVVTGEKSPPLLAQDALAEIGRRLGTTDEISETLHPLRMNALGGIVDTKNGIYRDDDGFDVRRTEVPYVLGSLFAVMEEIQRRAIPSIARNKRGGIAERWLREAGRNPARVFSIVNNLSRQHIIKMQKRRISGYYWLNDIYLSLQNKIETVPHRFNAEGQALFMLGYDHGRHALRWRKRPSTDGPDEEASAEAEAEATTG